MKYSKIVSFLVIFILLITAFPVQTAHATSDTTTNSQVVTWTPCAVEGGFCTFTGTKLVRYGSGTTYVTGTFTDGVACTNGVFGDPTPGVVKTCEYSDPPAPALNSFTRQNPATSPTNADTLIFRVTFSEEVQNIDSTDFVVNSTSTATVTNLSEVGGTWIYCADENGFCAFTGTRFVRYGAPGFYSANTGPFTNGVACTNAVFGDPIVGTVKTCEIFATDTYDITVSGGDLTSYNGTVGLDLATGQNIQNLTGTALPTSEPTTDEIYVLDNTVPSLTSFTRQNPAASPTSADTLVFRATFSKDVQNVDAADFTVNSTTTATITNVAMISASVYDITVSGGDLAGLNGTVGLNLAGGQNIQDLVGNTLPTGEPGTDETYTVNNTAPLVASTDLAASYTSTGPASFTVTFSKDVDDPAGNTGTDDVTNPANYILLEEGTPSGFQTTACNATDFVQDTQMTVSSVSYDNTTFASTVTLVSALPVGSYRLFICGTTSIVDLAGNPLNGGSDYTFDFNVQAAPTVASVATTLPATGFAQGRITSLPEQPVSMAYTNTDLVLEIPTLNVEMNIVGVPQSEKSWDVTWLGYDAGWLNGSAFPTWSGNTVLTGHVWDSFNRPGPFANLKSLKYGDQFYIHAYGQTYTYEVRESKTYWANTAVSKVFQHEDLDWVTLVTCETYNPLNGDYIFRRAVRAVLVSVK